jgi:hypothetical protein
VRIAIDWARSPALSLEVAPGETVHLRCAANTAQPILAGITFGRGKYVRLWRAEASDEAAGVVESLPVPRLRVSAVALLLAALGIAVANGRVVEAALIGLLALAQAALIGAWAIARRRARRARPPRA